MLNVHELSPEDFVGLSPAATAQLAARVLAHLGEQSRQIESQAQAIQFKDARIESIMFELRRLKAWQFDAKTERMNAQQRQLFEETLAADQAALEAQLAALQAASSDSGDTTPLTPTSAASQRARHCRIISSGWNTTTSQRTRRAAAVKPWCVLAKT